MSAQDLAVNRVPLPIRAAIARRGGRLILLYYADHPDGALYAWSGSGTLKFQSQIWRGFGDLVSIDGLGGSRKTEVRTVTATLAGLDPSQLAFVTKKVRGRLATLSLAALRTDQRAVDGDTFTLCYGKCDSQDQKIDAQQNASIVLAVNQPVMVLDRSPNMAWTPEWLKSQYGSDIVGLDDLPNIATQVESWGPAS